LFNDLGVRVVYEHPAPSGLPRQRNIGIDLTHGDPLFFIDDDVRLAPGCHHEVLKEYERSSKEVGGVRPEPIHDQTPGLITHRYSKLFGLGGWWPDNSGKILPGFFGETVASSAEPVEVEFFSGSFMSFRRELLNHERFDETLAGYAYKEDWDLSYRISRRATLIQTPRARYEHLRTPATRVPVHRLERMRMINQLYLHKKLLPSTLGTRTRLFWAIFGTLLFSGPKALKERDVGWLTGPVAGVAAHVSGRGLSPDNRKDTGRPRDIRRKALG
jgi:glycosyltransferase involved in cell wall biosynthesis